jgi:hypothetical protein
MDDIILYQVAKYYAKEKDLSSLINFSKVNKVCNFICKSDLIWKTFLKSKFNYDCYSENNLYEQYFRGNGFVTNDKAIINCLLNLYGKRSKFIASFFIKTSQELQKYCIYENGQYLSFNIDLKLRLDEFMIFGYLFQNIEEIDIDLLFELNSFLKYIFDERNVQVSIQIINDIFYLIIKKIKFKDIDLIEGFGENMFNYNYIH